jgi:hypothetical protein
VAHPLAAWDVLMDAVIDKLFIPGMLLGLISPLVAILSVIVLYGLHRGRVEPERRVPLLAYVLALIVCGGIAGYAGMIYGMMLACPKAGNLCGLFGVFATGPISFSLVIFAVGLALFLVKPAPKS